MATEKRLIDANVIPYEEYYVPDPDSNAQWDYKKEQSVLKPVIDQMPTIDAVEVVHGRWIQSEPGCRLCSHCMADVAIYSGHTNYCPNCGADMRERKDND